MLSDLAVFMVTHSIRCNRKEKWIIPIQVGMQEGKIQLEKNVDNIGDNISEKNKVFCELTGLYWVWRNTKYKYVGLCHYRRIFKASKKNILSCLNEGKIIVPKPKYFKMSIEKQYIREHGYKEWNVMLKVLQEIFPEYYASSKSVFSNNKLYPYNMFIGNRNFMNEYCLWLFNILFEVEKRVGSIEKDSYQIRYIGFLAERLFTLYIVHSKLMVKETHVLFNDKLIWVERFKCIVNNNIFKVIHKVKGDTI